MKLILVRHGETTYNVKRLCQGQKDIPLSKTGMEQGEKLGLRFKNRKIDAIYSSDLQRAVNTAKYILKYHPRLKLKKDKRLRERCFGEFEGKSFLEGNGFDWNNLPKDVETDFEVHNRIKEFFNEIYPKNKNKTVVVVFHGGPKRAFLTLLHKKPISQTGLWEKPLNTSVSEFEINKKGVKKTHSLNCVKHLE